MKIERRLFELSGLEVRKADGKQHKLRVEVPPMDVNKDGKPDKLKVQHKRGYYAPKS